MQLLVVTGMSGAGKSITVNALEDIGYYCVDNIPPQLISKFLELFAKTAHPNGKIAMVMDCRGREMFADLLDTLTSLGREQVDYKILFLDCDDTTLINRYKETRRKHPALCNDISSLEEAISYERNMLADTKNAANYVVDTTYLSVNQLKQKISGIFCEDRDNAFLVNFVSFGFKFGLPADCDLIFDVRCLPNPYYQPDLREHTGLETAVQDYVMDSNESDEFYTRLTDLLRFLLPLYRDREGKSQIVIGFGCTGGKHRSVTFAQRFYEQFQRDGYHTIVTHRDIRKNKIT